MPKFTENLSYTLGGAGFVVGLAASSLWACLFIVCTRASSVAEVENAMPGVISGPMVACPILGAVAGASLVPVSEKFCSFFSKRVEEFANNMVPEQELKSIAPN